MKGHKMEYRGLLYKDLMNLRSSFVVLAVMLIIFGIIFIPSTSFIVLFLMPLLFAPLMVTSTLTMDNQERWNSFVLTTAVSRKDVVRSKYLLMMLLSIPLWAIVILLYLVLMAPAFPIDTEGLTPMMVLLCIAAGLVHGSIMIPLQFKTISNVTHYLSIIVIVLLAIVVSIIYAFMMDAVGTALYPVALAIVVGVCVVSIVAFGISYLLSQRIFAKKEF